MVMFIRKLSLVWWFYIFIVFIFLGVVLKSGGFGCIVLRQWQIVIDLLRKELLLSLSIGMCLVGLCCRCFLFRFFVVCRLMSLCLILRFFLVRKMCIWWVLGDGVLQSFIGFFLDGLMLYGLVFEFRGCDIVELGYFIIFGFEVIYNVWRLIVRGDFFNVWICDDWY